MGPVPQAGHGDGHHQVREVGRPEGRRAGGRAGVPDSTHQHLIHVLSRLLAPTRRYASLHNQVDFFLFGTGANFLKIRKHPRMMFYYENIRLKNSPGRFESESQGGPAARPWQVSSALWGLSFLSLSLGSRERQRFLNSRFRFWSPRWDLHPSSTRLTLGIQQQARGPLSTRSNPPGVLSWSRSSAELGVLLSPQDLKPEEGHNS